MLCQTIANIWVKVVLKVNAALQQTLLLSPAPNPILEGSHFNALPDCKVLVIVVLGFGLMLLQSKLVYCLRLHIQFNARGGDLNTMPDHRYDMGQRCPRG